MSLLAETAVPLCAPAGYARRVAAALRLVEAFVPNVNHGRMDTIPATVLAEIEELLVGGDPVRTALLAARDLVAHVREHGALPESRVLDPLLAIMASADAERMVMEAGAASRWLEVAPGLLAFSGALAAEFDRAGVPQVAGAWLSADPPVLLEALRARALEAFSNFLAAGETRSLRAHAAQAGLLVFMAAAAAGAYEVAARTGRRSVQAAAMPA